MRRPSAAGALSPGLSAVSVSAPPEVPLDWPLLVADAAARADAHARADAGADLSAVAGTAEFPFSQTPHVAARLRNNATVLLSP